MALIPEATGRSLRQDGFAQPGPDCGWPTTMVTQREKDMPLPPPGERVTVEWGIEELDGRVLEVSGTTGHKRIVVEILGGQVSDSAAVLTVPVGAIEPAESANSRWASARRYEIQVLAALVRIVGQTNVHRARVDLRAAWSPDFLVRLSGEKRVAIEVYWTVPESSEARVLSASKRRISAIRNSPIPALLISNVALPAPLVHELPPHIAHANWRNESDDDQIRRALVVL